MKYFYILLLMLLPLGLFAQEMPENPEEAARQLYESIQHQVDRYTDTYKLDEVQIFFIDSIFVHNYTAMQEELDALTKAKVGNMDLYYNVRDRWDEATYQAVLKVLDEKQTAKYLKTMRSEKKARDKRMAKLQNQ